MNLTLSLDEELIGAAKALAARHGTSVTALVRQALEQQVAVDAQMAASGACGVLQALADYSVGHTPRGVAMQSIGVDDYGDFLALLHQARLPHPVVALAKRKVMAAQMVAVFMGAGVDAGAP